MSRRRIMTVAAGVALSSSLLSVPAHAAAERAQDRVECTVLSSGQLCISLNVQPSSVSVFYLKKSGSSIKASLGHRTTNGGSSFAAKRTIKSGERALERWTFSYRCDIDWKGVMKVDGQGTFETPWATC
ncbi:hypothetical protein H8R17_06205 [Streptomyces sp. TRM68367]|nr:hypothetical protein [Streptomyces sp. TRM68367]